MQRAVKMTYSDGHSERYLIELKDQFSVMDVVRYADNGDVIPVTSVRLMESPHPDSWDEPVFPSHNRLSRSVTR